MTAQDTIDESSVHLAADLIGAPRPRAEHFDFGWGPWADDFFRNAMPDAQFPRAYGTFAFDAPGYATRARFDGYGSSYRDPFGFDGSAGFSSGYKTYGRDSSFGHQDDGARWRYDSQILAQSPALMARARVLKTCQIMLAQMREAADRQARYAFVARWSQSLVDKKNLVALAGHVGCSRADLFDYLENNDDTPWLTAVAGASSTSQENKSYLRQMALMLHPDKLMQQGTHLSDDARQLRRHLYLICRSYHLI